MLKNWLRETHGTGFELMRHFLRRFFDNELITTSGQMTMVLAGAIPVFLQWFFLLIGPLRRKYGILSAMSSPGPYLEAVRADELWLITLMMSLIGLLTALKWHSLFPDLRDYRTLGVLPLRPRQIFAAKLAVLLLVASIALITVNLLPSLVFPAISGNRWSVAVPLSSRIRAYAIASIAGSAFFFFAFVALQGVLLNLLRPRTFGRVAWHVQGLLVAIMLVLMIVSFSIQPEITRWALQPNISAWLPPVWFLGLCQYLAVNPDPVMAVLAHRAQIALMIAVALAVLTYLVSYQRHRTLLMEGAVGQAANRLRSGRIFGWVIPNPRQQAIVAFMAKTLARSGYHRMILMGYAGLAFAFVATSAAGATAASAFVYFHLIALLLFLAGSRHLFSYPVEIKANWIFQVTEGEGRGAWLRAVDRFVLVSCGVLLLGIPLPLEILLLGWRGLAEAVLFLLLGGLTYEWIYFSWDKLPFTCSYLPGKTPMSILALRFFGLIALIGLLHSVLIALLFNDAAVIAAMVLSLAAWIHVHGARRQGWVYLRLQYDEQPAPAVFGLNLLK